MKEDGINGESEEIQADELCQEELTEENLLHGYVHDSNYDPQNMEEDGEFVEELEWEYHEVPMENLAYAAYNGIGPSLHPGVSQRFDNVLDACAVAGGFSYDLIKRITAHTNASVRSKLVGYSFLREGVAEYPSPRDVLDAWYDLEDEFDQLSFWWYSQLFHSHQESLSNL